MANAEIVTVGGREYTARILTVKDIIDIFDQAGGRELDVIDHLFEDGLDSLAFYRSLQITIDDVSALSPEEVRQLMEAVAKANPTYAEMEKRLKTRLAELRRLSSASVVV